LWFVCIIHPHLASNAPGKADLLPVSTLDERLGLLRRLRPAARRAAVIASIRAARGGERADILAFALEAAPADPELLVDLATLWADLPPEARDSLVESGLRDPIGIADRLSAAEAPGPDAGAAFAARALVHPAMSRQHALALAARLSTHLRAGATPAWVLDELTRATRDRSRVALLDDPITIALEHFPTHRHEPTLLGALRIAADPGPRLRAWLRNADDPAHFALRSAVRRLPMPSFVDLAMPLLGAPALAPIAAARIATLPDHESAPVLSQGHRLRIRARAEAIRRAGGTPSLTPMPNHPVEARRGSLSWIGSSSSSPVARCALLGARLTDADPAVRLGAVRGLCALPPTPGTDRALVDFALDASEPVARRACAALTTVASARRKESLTQAVRTLTRSPHASVRARALRAEAALGYTETATGLRSWTSPIGARKALRADRARVIADLTAQLTSATVPERLDAIRLIDRLQIARECCATLLGALGDADPRIVASVIRVVARTGDSEARLAVIRALGHADDRVRANALEELHRTPGPSTIPAPPIEAFTHDPVPRIRANAVHALLRGSSATTPTRTEILKAMLTDERASHRRSGLWVVERLAVLPLAPMVAEIVRNEKEPQVRHRAIRCGKRLLDHLLAASASAHTTVKSS